MKYRMTFYNKNGANRGRNKVDANFSQQDNWDDIRGDKQFNKAGFPIELPSRIIQMYSKKQEIIIDPFIGNGTTLIACEKLDRICFGMEIEPRYCDIAIKRQEEYTGNKAKLLTK